MTRSYLGYVSSQTTDTIFAGTYGTATGGSSSSITVGGEAYTLLTFTSSGTLTVSKSGLFDVLVVGGGGSGGLQINHGGAGGGGGGAVIQETLYLDANATITVGAKGAAQTTSSIGGNRGSLSRCDLLLAGGGGGGKANDTGTGAECGIAAGSGAGGQGGNAFGTAGTAAGVCVLQLANVANDGGIADRTGTLKGGGGGGGATAAGSAASNTTGGNGGTGFALTTFTGGTVTTHAGCGGGGAGGSGGSGGTAGNSSGGNGGVQGSTNGSNATSTFYGSGGGAGGNTTSGAGSDGVVFVRFKV